MEHSHPRAAPEDGVIIEGIISRDENALGLLSAKYRALLYRIALNILGDKADAEECVNDCLLAVWNSVSEGGKYDLPAFATAILRNIARARLRDANRQKRAPASSVPLDELSGAFSPQVSAEDEFFENELAAAISEFLRGLPREKRFIFIARYYECCSAADIAHTVGKSESSVHKTLSRTAKELKHFLQKKGFEI